MEDNRPDKRVKYDNSSDKIFDSLKIIELPNGVQSYFVETNNPPGTGSISLIVKAGMLCEERSEAGVAHFLEHLIIRAGVEAMNSSFLDRLSAHEHHETALKDTTFKFPIHKEDEALEAIKLYSLIASRKVVINEGHLEAERKIIAMEFMENMQDNVERASDDFYCSLVEGSSSSETCHKNLMNLTSSMVNNFYQKWYLSSRMALLVIGNFDAKLLTVAKESFSGEKLTVDIPLVRRCETWKSELKLLNNAGLPNVVVFKLERFSNLIEKWARMIIVEAISKRLKHVKKIVQGFAHIVDKGSCFFVIIGSHSDLKKVVYECLRLTEHGLTSSEFEREQTNIRKQLVYKTAMCKLDKNYRIDVLETKLKNHFLYDDKIVEPNEEVRDSEALISLPNLARDYLRLFEITGARIYLKALKFDSIGSLIAEVKNKFVAPWDKKLINFDKWSICENRVLPSRKHFKKIGMYEYTLSNGMCVLLCQSRVPYQCSMKGFAYGGVYEQDKNKYLSSHFALDIVRELQPFVLEYDLVGRDEMTMDLNINEYIRSFEASFDISELTVALQLVYLLFCEKPNSSEVELQKVMGSLREKRTALDRAYEYANENLSFRKLPTSRDISQVDALKALEFFSECFLDPSQFTLVIVGDFEIETALSSVQKYLGPIPRVSCDTFPSDRNMLKTFPIAFPEREVWHDIYCQLSFKEVYICLPLKMEKEKQDEDEAVIENLKTIVLQRLKTLLRCQMQEVYNASAQIFFDGKMYSSPGSEDAILLLKFSYYAQGSLDTKLMDKALEEIEDLRNAPTEEDLACLPAYLEPTEVLSSSILEEIVKAYQAKHYTGDLEDTILERRNMLKEIGSNRDIQSWKKIFERVMPYPCTKRYVCVAFHDKGKESESNDEDKYVASDVSLESDYEHEEPVDDSDEKSKSSDDSSEVSEGESDEGESGEGESEDGSDEGESGEGESEDGSDEGESDGGESGEGESEDGSDEGESDGGESGEGESEDGSDEEESE